MTAVAPVRRGSLFAKYFLSLIGIVTVVLVLKGAVDFWFSYQNTRDALIRIQQEKADSAALRVEQFVAEIEHQIGWTTLPQWATWPAEQRRFDFIRLQVQVPAIYELIQIDGGGLEQLKVSRLTMDVIGGQVDWSGDPRFTEIQTKKVYFSPVYLRKDSEPYMSVSVARRARRAGATVAEVNLKLMLEVVSAIKVGQSGYTFVVDRNGKLIAHPDISLVLRNTDASRLGQVHDAAAALGEPGAPLARVAGIHINFDGRQVLTAVSRVPRLDWLVFVELPLGEALRPLYVSLLQTAVLLALGLAVAAVGAWFLARRMTVPIRALSAGAAELGAGALEHRIQVRTGDELQTLAEGFNRMAERLGESYAGLEQKVAARTEDLNAALENQTAISDVLKVISSSAFNLEPVLQTVAETAARLCGASEASVFRIEEGVYRWGGGHRGTSDYIEMIRGNLYVPGRDTLVGRTALEGRVVQIADALEDPEYSAKETARKGGVRTLLGVPLLRQGKVIGVLALSRQQVEPFTEQQIEVLEVFADQAVIAIENVRLFQEIQDKSRQLEIASQHKSQFLANMSHELRTPLNAVLGYAELMLDGIYGDVPDKARGVLDRIQSNGKHLLALINDVLDLSKIEAGQLKLALEPYSLGAVLNTVAAATESLATNKGLAFCTEVDGELPTGHGDERRLALVMLNLVGNAIKFTDKGEIRVHAGRRGDEFEIAVADTGPGIAAEDQARIFEEFQQVDNTSTRKKGGTGLGLAISRRIVEMHGGRMSVESRPGLGATFRVTLPIHVREQVAA